MSLLLGQILSPGAKLASQLISAGGALASQIKQQGEGRGGRRAAEARPRRRPKRPRRGERPRTAATPRLQLAETVSEHTITIDPVGHGEQRIADVSSSSEKGTNCDGN